jgi:hypothetical protein
MPDFTALELPEASIPAPLTTPTTTSLADDLRAFVTGALLTAAVAAAGTVVVILALTVGVVGAPVLALAFLYLVVRRRRAERIGATVLDTAAS